MKAMAMGAHEGIRDWVVVFDPGEDPVEGLLAFARTQGIGAARFFAVGAFERATLGFFELARKDYRRNEVAEQVEVAALAGNVATVDGEPKVHAHVVLGRADGSALAGHLLAARVQPTLEVMLTAWNTALTRHHDPATGLPLLGP